MMKITMIWIFLAVPLFAQTPNETAILLLQDQRAGFRSELSSFLRSPVERERELALLAIANIQDTAFVDVVGEALSDDRPSVRRMAAFAMGMLGHPRGPGLLVRRLAVEREERNVAELLNAIGLCGTSEDLKKLIAQSEHYQRSWRPHVARSIYRFANRRIKETSATKYLVPLLSENESVWNATYALLRINDTSVTASAGEQLRSQLAHRSPEIRMWSATLLGSLQDKTTLQRLLVSAQRDKDWRVRVNALRAVRKKPEARRVVIARLSDPNEHVALAAIEAYVSLSEGDKSFRDSTAILSLFRKNTLPGSVRDELLKVIAAKMGERAMPLIGGWSSEKHFTAAQRVRAYGATGSAAAIPVIKEAIARSPHSLVTIAGLESYQRIALRSEENIKKDFLKTAVLAFQKKDAGVSYTAATAFQDTAFSTAIRSIYLSALIDAYRAMKAEVDLEPMVELLNVFSQIGDSTALPAIRSGMAEKEKVIRTAAEKAFTAVTGEEPEDRSAETAVTISPFYKLSDLVLLDRYEGAEIVTNKGKISVRFEKNGAPFSVLNFILLAQKKFYDGLPFHRVVGNFVIQGGDPLGNGSGGPNYAIRTEVHPDVLYRTGAVGMASAGKDTEGSQWFVTHTPTPHLDYRYTIFAWTNDAAVVDTIVVGDTIVKVTVF